MMRPLTPRERETLVAAIDSGSHEALDRPVTAAMRDAWRRQVEDLRVVGECECGCPTIELGREPSDGVGAPGERRIIGGSVGSVDLILFVDDGTPSLLEQVDLAEAQTKEFLAPEAWTWDD